MQNRSDLLLLFDAFHYMRVKHNILACHNVAESDMGAGYEMDDMVQEAAMNQKHWEGWCMYSGEDLDSLEFRGYLRIYCNCMNRNSRRIPILLVQALKDVGVRATCEGGYSGNVYAYIHTTAKEIEDVFGYKVSWAKDSDASDGEESTEDTGV